MPLESLILDHSKCDKCQRKSHTVVSGRRSESEQSGKVANYDKRKYNSDIVFEFGRKRFSHVAEHKVINRFHQKLYYIQKPCRCFCRIGFFYHTVTDDRKCYQYNHNYRKTYMSCSYVYIRTKYIQLLITMYIKIYIHSYTLPVAVFSFIPDLYLLLFHCLPFLPALFPLAVCHT